MQFQRKRGDIFKLNKSGRVILLDELLEHSPNTDIAFGSYKELKGSEFKVKDIYTENWNGQLSYWVICTLGYNWKLSETTLVNIVEAVS